MNAPRMKAVIWFLVIDEDQIPMAIICAARSAAPTYCASMIPASASETASTPIAMGRVPASVTSTKSQLPRNLPSTTSVSLSGCAMSHSSVRPRRSSARLRMVTAGDKDHQQPGKEVEEWAQRGRRDGKERPEGEVEAQAQEGDREDIGGRLVEEALEFPPGDKENLLGDLPDHDSSSSTGGPW